MDDVPDGARFTADQIIGLCVKYPIEPYISTTTGAISFIATAGAIPDGTTRERDFGARKRTVSNYKKIRKTFSAKACGGIKNAFEAAREWVTGIKSKSLEEKVHIAALPSSVVFMVTSAMEECAKRQTNLTDIIHRGFRHFDDQAIKNEITFSQAAEALAEARRKAGRDEVYIRDIRTYFNAFGAEYGETKLHQITADEIEDFLEERDLSPTSWNNWRRHLAMIWNFGMESRNGWVRENAASEVVLKDQKDEEVTALTIDQAKAVLRSAHLAIPRLIPYLVLGMFCGFRRTEAQRADWSDMDFDTSSIMVRVTKSRTASNRYPHLQEVALDWLRPIAQAGGPMCTGKYARRDDLAQLRTMTFNFDGNIFRHSFGSYHYRAFNRPQETIVEMGHTTVQMLFSHYRRPVPQTTACEYWKLTRSAVLDGTQC
jgi:integrase